MRVLTRNYEKAKDEKKITKKKLKYFRYGQYFQMNAYRRNSSNRVYFHMFQYCTARKTAIPPILLPSAIYDGGNVSTNSWLKDSRENFERKSRSRLRSGHFAC